jgi:hypothetical protein
MIKRKIIAAKWFVPLDLNGECLDLSSWSTDQKEKYFIDHYDTPPVRPGQEAVKFLLGQLTPAQYSQQHSLNIQTPGSVLNNPYWFRYIICHGVKDWAGFTLEDDHGNEREIKPKFIESVSGGKRLSDESYDDLVFFSNSEVITMCNHILSLSRM